MNGQKWVSYFGCLFFVLTGFAQDKTRLLQIGDFVPNVSIKNVYNYPSKSFRISDFKGKLVIFDFWNTYCKGCIEAFPKLDSIQKRFGDRVQIILVNQQSQQTIDGLWDKVKVTQGLYRNIHHNLASVTSDSILNSLFLHYTVPYNVWIDQNGKVIAKTEARYVTANNIEALLNGQPVNLPEFKEFLTQDSNEPILQQLYGLPEISIPFYSCLIKGAPQLMPSNLFTIDEKKGIARITISNSMPILSLYGSVFSRFRGTDDDPFQNSFFDFGKRVILEVKDSARYFYNDATQSFEKWKKENCYVYEAVVSNEEFENRFDIIISDLNKYFGINGRVEKRRMKCLALVRVTNLDKVKYKGRKDFDGARRYVDTNNILHLEATSLASLREYISINNPKYPYPIVDNTNYSDLVSMQISSPLNDLKALKKELQAKYDLDIVETELNVEVMILTEKELERR